METPEKHRERQTPPIPTKYLKTPVATGRWRSRWWQCSPLHHSEHHTSNLLPPLRESALLRSGLRSMRHIAIRPRGRARHHRKALAVIAMMSSHTVSLLLHILRPVGKAIGALRPRVDVLGSFGLEGCRTLFFREYKSAPFTTLYCVLSHSTLQDVDPARFIRCVVGVEVDCLAIREANAKAFLDKLVALVIFRKGRLATSFARLVPLRVRDERAFIVNDLRCFCKVDLGSRLTSRLMVSCELRAYQTEEASTPKLRSLLVSYYTRGRTFTYRAIATLLT